MSMLMLLLDPPKVEDSSSTPRRGVKPGTYTRHVAAANKARQEQAQERYKAAMGDEWIGTNRLERRLGYNRSSILSTLVGYAKKGLVEKRPYNNEPFNCRKGWEWKWKQVSE